MRPYIRFWMFPLAVLGGLMLLSLNSLPADVLALVWGFVVVPHGAALLARHLRDPDGSRAPDDAYARDTQYWRTDAALGSRPPRA